MVKSRLCVPILLFSLVALSLDAQQSEPARRFFKETKAKADKGDASSQFAVGKLYASGTGVEADARKALKYYKSAAEKGLAPAQYELGLLYAAGKGTKKDSTEAAYWFTQSAQQNFLDAQLELGRCFLSGKGVRISGTEALKWFRTAAAQGSPAADYHIGKCYLEGTGVSRDIEEGVKWIRRSAEAGFAPAQNAYGNCFDKGTGVEKDYLQAYKWFALAAAQDDANAADIRVSIAKAEQFLTKEQVAEAQRLAREFKPVAASKTASPPGEAPRSTSRSGLVNVNSEDPGSEILVDGTFVGNTPAKLKLDSGKHVIEVKRPGSKNYKREINLTAGSELTIRVVSEKQ